MDLQEIKKLEKEEFIKRDKELCLIPSEGFPSEDVLWACKSVFSLKYAEGFAHKRYYCGCETIDKMEELCQELCLELFNAKDEYNACVQPHSGSNANIIAYGAILEPNDTVLSMETSQGAHISHNHPLSFISKYHNVISYGLDENGFIDYEQVEKLALEHKPKLIICGTSAYPRNIDFIKFKDIANKCGAYLMADIAHITTLVAKKQHMTPVGKADIITFTTHKMLNGPRGGCILYKKELDKQIKRSVIPFSQGGPLENIIYSKLIAFNEMLQSNSWEYANQIVKNADVMAKTFIKNGIKLTTNGTDNHLMVIDLSDDFQISGRKLSEIFEKCGVITNCNTVPNDRRSFFETSGVRVGTPFLTKRGLKEEDFIHIADHMSDIIKLYKYNENPNKDELESKMEALKSCVEYYSKLYPLKNFYPKTYKELFERK